MQWQEPDLNDPELYRPRAKPTVQRADDVTNETALEYQFDDPEAWDTPLEAMPLGPMRRRKEPAANPYAHKRSSKGDKGKATQGHPAVYIVVSSLCVMALLAIGVMMMPQLAGYFWKDFDNFAFIDGELLRYDKSLVASYKQYRDYVRQDVIYPGVFVDGTHVGDMSVAQARELLQGQGSGAANPFSLTVNVGNKSWTVNNTNLAATRDLGNVLERAYAVGRSNTTAIIGTLKTPFRERVDTVLALREEGVNLTTTASYDHDAVRALVNEIVTYVTREPVDAQIQSFDFNTRTFAFTDEQPGVTVDGEKLYSEVVAKLDQWQQNAVLTVEPVVTQPNVTKADLNDHFKLVAAYTTTTTSSKNRNTNIDLACQAINGTVLMPGETFSFNKATGERTTAKGYKSAGAIAAGQSIEEVGGGICQVSSTLFNAVARADLEIVSRSPHAWPSTYVNKGEDATVNWPNLDFQFKNNRDTPVFVIAYYKDRKCSAEIWGLSLGEGVSIDLQSNVIKTIEPPSDVKYVQNPELPYGASEETVKARTGYVVETYKVWLKDGAELKRELMHTSTYKAYQRTVEYN